MTPWAPLKSTWPVRDDGYTIQDYVCEEFQSLVLRNTAMNLYAQQMKFLFTNLDLLWDEHFVRYMTTQLRSASGTDILKENIPSSFAIALQSLKWVPALETTVTPVGSVVQLEEKESLLPPSVLYVPGNV